MKRTVLALLSVLVLTGCYETKPVPEGLTEDNFYVGTFKIGDCTVELTETMVKVSDSTKVLCELEKTEDINPDYGFFKVDKSEFRSGKNFKYSVFGIKFLGQNEGDIEERALVCRIELIGTENGFSFDVSLHEELMYADRTGRVHVVNSYFSNYEEILPPKHSNETAETKFQAVPEIEWNGKRYKSTLKAAFDK